LELGYQSIAQNDASFVEKMCDQMIDPLRQTLIEPRIGSDLTINRILEADHQTIVWSNKLIVVRFLTLDKIYI